MGSAVKEKPSESLPTVCNVLWPESHLIRTAEDMEILPQENALQCILSDISRVQNRFTRFFKEMGKYQDELDSLLTENFHIIGERISVSQS